MNVKTKELSQSGLSLMSILFDVFGQNIETNWKLISSWSVYIN